MPTIADGDLIEDRNPKDVSPQQRDLDRVNWSEADQKSMHNALRDSRVCITN
jgi:hypothetical protein